MATTTIPNSNHGTTMASMKQQQKGKSAICCCRKKKNNKRLSVSLHQLLVFSFLLVVALLELMHQVWWTIQDEPSHPLALPPPPSFHQNNPRKKQQPQQLSVLVAKDQQDTTTTTTTTTTNADAYYCQMAPPGLGPEGTMGYQALLKVQIATATPNNLNLLCVVLVMRDQSLSLLNAIQKTYAPHCDGFLAFYRTTTITKDNLSFQPKQNNNSLIVPISITTPSSPLLSQEQQTWVSDWELFQGALRYLVTNRLSSRYDIFHVAPDDTYVIPSNLKALAQSYDGLQTQPFLLGATVIASRQAPQQHHCGGGAGITLNRPALQVLAQQLVCPHHDDDDNNGMMMILPADQHLAACIRRQNQQQQQQVANKKEVGGMLIQNVCTKTTSREEGSALRYLEFGLDYQAKWNMKKNKQKQKTTGQLPLPIKAKQLAQHFGINTRAGLDGIATDLVSIHLVHGTQSLEAATKTKTKTNTTTTITNDSDNHSNMATTSMKTTTTMTVQAMYRIHSILYHLCDDQWEHAVDALDEQGNPGYIHDPATLFRNPLALTLLDHPPHQGVCDAPFGMGMEGKDGYKGLQKITVTPPTTTTIRKKKVLCMIYTHSGRHESLVRAIAETYGSRCDGFLAASNMTNPRLGTVHILHEGPEAYQNMWLKVRSMWQYAHMHYLNDYDYFHIGGDDHYVIAENLRYVATVMEQKQKEGSSNDNMKPLFMGGNMIDFPHTQIRYCGGGSGYTLNRAALKLLVEQLWNTPACRPHHRAPDEDRIISRCFQSIGIPCQDTNDDLGESRYHQATVDFHASWTQDQPSVWHARDLEQVHGIVSKEKLGQISTTSVSFHLKNDDHQGVPDLGMRRYHAILYGLCDDHVS